MSRQRCVCGRSSRLPLCDGAHRAEGWSCRAAAADRFRWGFAASPHYANLAERLAHELGGVALHRSRGPVEVEEVVAICQVSDSGSLIHLDRVQAERQRLLVVGEPGPLIAPAVADWPRAFLPNSSGALALWRDVMQSLALPHVPVSTAPPPSIFVSHAVADEERITPWVAELRALGAQVFSCSDSLRAGDRWRDTIVDALGASERVLVLVSAASRDSVWCAFEVGLAEGLGKPIDIVSIDGSTPPSFIGHLQMADLPRLRARQPWLDEGESFVEAVIEIWSERG